MEAKARCEQARLPPPAVQRVFRPGVPAKGGAYSARLLYKARSSASKLKDTLGPVQTSLTSTQVLLPGAGKIPTTNCCGGTFAWASLANKEVNRQDSLCSTVAVGLSTGLAYRKNAKEAPRPNKLQAPTARKCEGKNASANFAVGLLPEACCCE